MVILSPSGHSDKIRLLDYELFRMLCLGSFHGFGMAAILCPSAILDLENVQYLNISLVFVYMTEMSV